MALDNLKVVSNSVNVARATGQVGNVLPVYSKQFNDLVDEVSDVKDDLATLGTSGSVTATALGNHANNGQLLSTEVSLSKVEILALNSSPREVIAAPGAGKVIEFISAVLIYDYDTATYGAGGDVSIGYTGGAAQSTTVTAANSFGAAGDKVFSMSKLNAAGGYTMPVNTGLAISAATADFTDPGTAAGVGRLHITYRIHTTGL